MFYYYNGGVGNSSYSNDKQYQCNACPEGANKCYSNHLDLKPGFFRWKYDSTEVYACPLAESACAGSILYGLTSCNDGYTGAHCGVCKEGYYPTSDGRQCALCASKTFPLSQAIAVVIGVIIVMIVAIVILLSLGEAESSNPVMSFMGFNNDPSNEPDPDDPVADANNDSSTTTQAIASARVWLEGFVSYLPNVDVSTIVLTFIHISYSWL